MELNKKVFFCTKWHSSAWTHFFKPLLFKKRQCHCVLNNHISFHHSHETVLVPCTPVEKTETKEGLKQGKIKLESWFWLPPKCLIHSPTFQFTIKWNWHIYLKGKEKKRNDQSHSVNSGISKEVTVRLGISKKEFRSELAKLT